MKGWLVTYLIFLSHIPAFFMRSLIQTAEHKMVLAPLMNVLLNFQTSTFNKNNEQLSTEPKCIHYYYYYYNYYNYYYY